MLILGACHCGNIRFTFDWQPDPTEIIARACTCTFCVKHGNVWTSKPDAPLVVEFRNRSAATTYEFGTKTAQFHICSVCGIVPFVTCAIDATRYAVVNVNTFDADASALIRRVPATLDDENASDRLDRRRRNWISRVTLKPAAS